MSECTKENAHRKLPKPRVMPSKSLFGNRRYSLFTITYDKQKQQNSCNWESGTEKLLSHQLIDY